MLTREDNERLVRVGPGTPMGTLMRGHWIPFLPGSDLTPDGQPYRVRLLGEDLVAFRSQDGSVGLVDHACPHRGAPLMFGRNEDGGLRCVYHGWKFHADGSCREMPAEPAGTPMLQNVRIKAYPVRERNGVLWTYMGDASTMPELPEFEWNLVPQEQVAVSVRVQECNWLQALEGEIDSAHAAILHGRTDSSGTINQWRQAADLAPRFECRTHEAGVSIAAVRRADESTEYVRVNQFLAPFWTLVPPQSQYPELSGHAWVPIDDENTLCLMFSYHPSQPMYEKSLKVFRHGHAGRESGHASEDSFERRAACEPFHNYWSRFNRSNAYGFDYTAQGKTGRYNSGLPGLWIQDAASQSGVAPIYDRSREHLGTSDTGIAHTRRFLLRALNAMTNGEARPAARPPCTSYMVRAVSITKPTAESWQTAAEPFMHAKLGEGFGYTP